MRLTLHYDGAAFHGWQVQPEAPTVQSVLEAVLSRLADRPVRATAAGRTDAGVHATGQVVHVDVAAKWTPAALRRAVNALLPDSVWVASAQEAAPDFHARFDATARGYVYRLGLVPGAASPFLRRGCWMLGTHGSGGAPDASILDAAAARIVGERSFAAFAKAGQEERGHRCRVIRSGWSPWRAGVQYTVVADRFLHHMVRYLVGTMVEVARGRRGMAELDALLSGEPGVETSPPAPPEGLYLARVYYEPVDPKEPLDEDLP